MGHYFDMLTLDFLLKPPQSFTGLSFSILFQLGFIHILSVSCNFIKYI